MPEHSRDLPMVFVDREPVGIDADAVVSDNALGAAKAVAHERFLKFIEQVGRRIAGSKEADDAVEVSPPHRKAEAQS